MLARTACLFAAAVAFLLSYSGISAQSQTAPAALTGTVSSAEEGRMEGVVVSAKKGIVTVSVVSNDKGEFSFPGTKLRPGEYTLSIKASGWDLAGPASVTLGSGEPAAIAMKLVKARNLAAQLSNLEWITSVPGTNEQRAALSGCVNCHTLERIINSKHDADGMLEVIRRMATYSNNSFHAMPQIRAEARDLERFVPGTAKVAAYFASINLSKGERNWEIKTQPRVKGSGTRVVITEYDLPDPTIQPHDVMVDPDGVVWHSDFSGQRLGRFDTRTLAHKIYPVPLQRQGWPTGALDLQTDPQGNLWLGLMFQAGTAKFDRKTETFQMFQLPPHLLKDDSQQALIGPQNWTVDNRIWLQDPSRRGIYRMNVVTGETELFEPFAKTRGSPYSIVSDPKNNIWFLDFGGQNIGRIDAETRQITLYPTPTPRSRPRRGRLDDLGRIWFAQFAGERVGMFDTRTERFKEWAVPGRFFAPYDVAHDKLGNIWTGGMNADRILRISTESGEVTEYPLPRPTNIRRVFVDNTTSPPTFWVGSNHGASIIKLEPLD